MLRTVSELILISFIMEITLQQDAQVKFSCQGRAAGYYADVDSGCQIYHMCDGLGRQFSYSCPNTTLFQQRMLICDHWYMVNCSTSEIDYGANLLIGQNKPFVEDSEKEVYHRTPRPDLLSQPTASEYNIIYRKQGSQNKSDFDLVGVNSDYDQNNGSSNANDKPAYHLPSHWSTEYSKENVTPSLVNVPQQITEDKGQVTSPPTNTLSIDQTQVTHNEGIALSPENENGQNKKNTNSPSIRNTQRNKNFEGSNEDHNKTILKVQRVPIPKAINFDSNNLENAIKTKSTNSFPKKEIAVNFKSLFKATTPVFPTKEELGTTESPVDDILKPPASNDHEHATTLDIPPLATENKQSLATSSNSLLQPPSNIFQPPKLEPDYTTDDSVTELNNYSVKTESIKIIKGKIKTSTRLSNDKMFKDIRKIFSIPDYEFPLDTASRPGYDQSLDSFQVNPFLVDVKQRQHAS